MKQITTILLTLTVLIAVSFRSHEGAAEIQATDTVPYSLKLSDIVYDRAYFRIMLPGSVLMQQKRKEDTTLTIAGDTTALIRYMIDVLTTPKVPTVLIHDGDTTRYYGGDTLRVTSCGAGGIPSGLAVDKTTINQ